MLGGGGELRSGVCAADLVEYLICLGLGGCRWWRPDRRRTVGCCLTSSVVERFEKKRFWRDVRAASSVMSGGFRVAGCRVGDDRLEHLGVHWKLLREVLMGTLREPRWSAIKLRV